MGPIEEKARHLLAELEKVTARLEGMPPEEIEALATAMNERSALILELRELVDQLPPAAPPTPDFLEGLRSQLAATGAIGRKLLLARAAARAELMRLLEAGFLARSLARRSGRTPHIDCQG